jgi:hypothetical protein
VKPPTGTGLLGRVGARAGGSIASLYQDHLILDIAHAALAATFAIKQHVPGDAPEDHEDNTYGLPDGAPIRRRLRRFFRDQLKHVLSSVRSWRGVGIPDRFPRMADYNDPMKSAMTPLIGTYWDKAGKGLAGRLGLDPDEWRVTDPNVYKAIEQQCLKFCASTNATTDLKLGAAREAVRERLSRGLIGEGMTIPEMTREIQGVFTRLSKSHAQTIARTEVARAVHAAAEMSAIESGVVSGKRIMLSANSCQKCVAIAERAAVVPLGGTFGTVGHDADYSTVRMPPIHPRCRCSVEFVLVDPTKSPIPAFVPSAASGHPAAAVAEPEKPKPKPKPVEPKPVAAPKPGPNPVAIPTAEEHGRDFPELTISPDQVKAYTAHSKYKEITIHRTSAEGRKAILDNGIDITANKTGLYGQGFYAAKNALETYGPEAIRVVVDSRKPLITTDKKLLDQKIAFQKARPDLKPGEKKAAFSKHLLDEGYDSIVMEMKDGNQWMIALKSDNVRIVQ